MKIIYHHRTLGDGAEGIHIREMIHAFRSLGHTVTVVAPAGEDHAHNNRKIGILSIIKSALPGFFFELCEIFYSFYSFSTIYIICKKIKPDFIYDRYITFNMGGVIAARFLKIPIFLEVNAPLALERTAQPDEKLYLKKIAFLIERWVCSNTTKTIVVSTPLKKYLASIGVDEQLIVVLPNGVNHKKFTPHRKNKNLLVKYNIPEDHVIIGFTGVLRAWHGLDTLIESFKNVLRENNNVFLLIVGDGPIRRDIEWMIKNNDIENKCAITGMIPYENVHELVNIFDIAVSPKSTFYASPMKIVEYMALGKAVVVPDSDNFLDLIEPQLNGMIFSDKYNNKLTDILIKLIYDRILMKSIGINARKKVDNKMNWAENARKICGLM